MRLLGVAVCALTVATGAWAAGPNHTSAGDTAAKASLLTLANLGKDWTEGTTGSAGLVLSCPGWTPSHGATLSEITLSSFVSAVPAKVESALATVVARKLGVPAA